MPVQTMPTNKVEDGVTNDAHLQSGRWGYKRCPLTKWKMGLQTKVGGIGSQPS